MLVECVKKPTVNKNKAEVKRLAANRSGVLSWELHYMHFDPLLCVVINHTMQLYI